MIEKTVWFGEKRGVRFEINRFKSFDESRFKHSWTFYLWLCPEQFPEHFRGEISTRMHFTAYGTPIETCDTAIANLEWHGGLTWSSNESRPGAPFEEYKFGCDFQHLWDQDCHYDLDDIEREVDICIESLYLWCPEIKAIASLWEDFRAKFPRDKVSGIAGRYDREGSEVRK